MEEKRFDEWNEVKKVISRNSKIIPFHERDVWWYAAGENLGSEINGKGKLFSRPILIIRKYGKTTFFGVPLSTRNNNGFWYSNITVHGKNSCVLLSQAGSFSVIRLYKKIDRISESDFSIICSELGSVLLKITP